MQNDYQKPNHPKAPRLIRTDKDDPQNIVKVAGRSVRMKCRFAGEPEPEVRWLLNGGNVERIHSDYMEMNSTDLYLENLAPSDDGLYSCVAENSHGTSSYTYHLSVTRKFSANNLQSFLMGKSYFQRFNQVDRSWFG